MNISLFTGHNFKMQHQTGSSFFWMMTFSAGTSLLLTFGIVSAVNFTSVKERLIGYPIRAVVYSVRIFFTYI